MLHSVTRYILHLQLYNIWLFIEKLVDYSDLFFMVSLLEHREGHCTKSILATFMKLYENESPQRNTDKIN